MKTLQNNEQAPTQNNVDAKNAMQKNKSANTEENNIERERERKREREREREREKSINQWEQNESE